MGALAAGIAVAGFAADRRRRIRQVALILTIGLAPDLDLLWGRHSRETHSLGAAVLVASVAAWQRWPVASTRARIWWTTCLAWLSHPLLDMLGSDAAPPIGVMALWPLSTDHFLSGLDLFLPTWREYWMPGFWTHTLRTLLREVALLGPAATLVWWLRKRRP